MKNTSNAPDSKDPQSMQHKVKLTISSALAACILCAAGFGLIALWVSDSRIHNFDMTVIRWVSFLDSPTSTAVMKFFTFIGGGLPVVLITILAMSFLYVFLRHRKELIFMGAVVIGSLLLNLILKAIFERARPTINRMVEAGGYSFPSGHSMAAFSLYGALIFLVWKHVPSRLGRMGVILAGALFILMIGISRIYLGVHYPSDVLGGYFVSGCWLAFTIWTYQRMMKRRRRRHSGHEDGRRLRQTM
ncbi:phosphatase PAP2 family protein [Paenibacillus sp. JX-17]|uniref:Phosphatase PAP2 family protein n=1 Tax=Paenibacillus lacisoli TaxID=3064525 RepID=A0ABT9CG98_9BACL|nr:phosphatase PAP2 family protein [Paenibacillus sp. JX-17]MDO7908301.1 phosphatase PAP2 family protein [Paenibacillus sp. JX-17]